MDPMDPKSPSRAKDLSPVEPSADTSARRGPERRLLPRLTLSGEQFRLSVNGKVFGVVDLSQEGMALRLIEQSDRLLFPVGTRFSGSLNLNRTKFALDAQVRNLRGEQVGCQFVQIPEELRQELVQWLDPASLGASLRPMPSGASSDSIWYHGRSGTEVMVWPQGDSGPARVLVLLWGREFVEWDASRGVLTGEVKASDQGDPFHGVLRWTPEWLHADLSPDPSKLKIAKTLLISSKLPEEWKHRVQSGLVLPA